jgi:hypothetical protein
MARLGEADWMTRLNRARNLVARRHLDDPSKFAASIRTWCNEVERDVITPEPKGSR